MGGNTDRLHDAGLIEGKRVPDEFYAFIEELSDEEVATLADSTRASGLRSSPR